MTDRQTDRQTHTWTHTDRAVSKNVREEDGCEKQIETLGFLDIGLVQHGFWRMKVLVNRFEYFQ